MEMESHLQLPEIAQRRHSLPQSNKYRLRNVSNVEEQEYTTIPLKPKPRKALSLSPSTSSPFVVKPCTAAGLSPSITFELAAQVATVQTPTNTITKSSNQNESPNLSCSSPRSSRSSITLIMSPKRRSHSRRPRSPQRSYERQRQRAAPRPSYLKLNPMALMQEFESLDLEEWELTQNERQDGGDSIELAFDEPLDQLLDRVITIEFNGL